MEIKLFEVRSSCTFIAVMATKLGSNNEAENYLWLRSGYGNTKTEHERYIIVQEIDGGKHTSTSDEYKQEVSDVQKAHRYINLHFDELETGAVIDLEFIEGKTKSPKIAERLDR